MHADMDDLVSLTAILILKNMYKSPAIVCINENTDS